jgi:hypothetical protein
MLPFLEFVAIIFVAWLILSGLVTWVERKHPNWRNPVAFVLALGAAYAASFALDLIAGSLVGVYPFRPVIGPAFTWIGIACGLFIMSRSLRPQNRWICAAFYLIGGFACFVGLLGPHRYDILVGVPLMAFGLVCPAASPLRATLEEQLELLGLTDSQLLLRWLWLRATEWTNLPSFASQPIVPILFVFFRWPFVIAGVFALDVLWAFVRYRCVNVRAASYVANFVRFTKWPAAIGSAILLFIHHSILAGILALAWPLGLCGLIAIPGQIGKLQVLLARRIGPMAEFVIDAPPKTS